MDSLSSMEKEWAKFNASQYTDGKLLIVEAETKKYMKLKCH